MKEIWIKLRAVYGSGHAARSRPKPPISDTELFLIGQFREARMDGTDRNRLAVLPAGMSVFCLPLGTAGGLLGITKCIERRSA